MKKPVYDWMNRMEWELAPEDLKDKMQLWLDSSWAYYNIDDEPWMSDEEFDQLTFELKEELVDYPFALEVVNKTISTHDGQVQAEQTTSVMISLEKIQYENLSSVQKIYKFFMGAGNMVNCFYGPKMDGMAIKVAMNHDGGMSEVKQILTRGGQDVTALLINHPDVTRLLPTGLNIVHCELVVKKSVFMEKYSEDYANPRNAIGGILKINALDLRLVPLTDGTSPINVAGFAIWKQWTPELNYQEFYNKLKEENYPFQVDGIVIGYKTDTRVIKDNYPLNMVSVKFPSPTAKTKILGMEWSQKKSGKLTPVYLVEPTLLDGSTVSRVNAYNYDTILKSHAGIGSEILISKSNDIIPVVKKVLTRSDNVTMPEVEYKTLGKHLYAVNMEISKEYKFILAMKLLDLDGIGNTIADQIGSLVGYNIIELFDDIHKPRIRQLLGGGKVWEKFEVFYQIKKLPLDQLINLMQFDRCGKVLSKKFADIITGKPIDVKGIESNVLLYVCRGEGFAMIKSNIETLRGYGVQVIKPQDINENTITFEMSGNPPGMNKKEFVDALKKSYPNSTHITLNKDTKYLIVDDIMGTSSKCNKARKYNIPIVTYSDALSGKLK